MAFVFLKIINLFIWQGPAIYPDIINRAVKLCPVIEFQIWKSTLILESLAKNQLIETIFIFWLKLPHISAINADLINLLAITIDAYKIILLNLEHIFKSGLRTICHIYYQTNFVYCYRKLSDQFLLQKLCPWKNSNAACVDLLKTDPETKSKLIAAAQILCRQLDVWTVVSISLWNFKLHRVA